MLVSQAFMKSALPPKQTELLLSLSTSYRSLSHVMQCLGWTTLYHLPTLYLSANIVSSVIRGPALSKVMCCSPEQHL